MLLRPHLRIILLPAAQLLVSIVSPAANVTLLQPDCIRTMMPAETPLDELPCRQGGMIKAQLELKDIVMQ